jgi:hypothetical protein
MAMPLRVADGLVGGPAGPPAGPLLGDAPSPGVGRTSPGYSQRRTLID